VHFADPEREAHRNEYQYAWQLLLPPDDACLGNSMFVLSQIAPWTAEWQHPGCEHGPGELIRVTVTRGTDQIALQGPALGPAQVTP
jgi:hypothetical protein